MIRFVSASKDGAELAMPPLVVDLDGTLVLGDTSWRAFGLALKKNPLGALAACGAYMTGIAIGKRAIAEIARPAADKLPYRGPLLKYLEKERARERKVHLVTGADDFIANDVGAHLGLFDSVHGSNGRINLRGPEKLAWLDARFPGGFDYIGDSEADLPIWRAVGRAMLVGRAINYASRLREEGVHILATI
jgi:hypothetical protein